MISRSNVIQYVQLSEQKCLSMYISHQQIVDDAIRKTSRIVSIVVLPVFLVSTYRNLYVDFLPLHSTFMTILYLGFVSLSTDVIKTLLLDYMRLRQFF